MKPIYKILILFIICLTGCNNRTSSPESIRVLTSDDILFYEYDGCEYIQSKGTGMLSSHRGTCKNPIHRQNCAIDTLKVIDDYYDRLLNSINNQSIE